MLILVVGSSRSGTTLLATMLGKCEGVMAFKELHFFERLWTPGREEVLQKKKAQTLARELARTQSVGLFGGPADSKAIPDSVRSWTENLPDTLTGWDLYLNFLRTWTRGVGDHVAVAQTPRNLYFTEDLLNLDEHTRSIVMVRDPRAVTCSRRGKWKLNAGAGKWMPWHERLRQILNYHPMTAAWLWRSAARETLRIAGHERLLSVQYEEFVTDPVENLKGICAFLGLDYDERMLQVPLLGSSHGGKSSTQGISTRSVDAWKNGSFSSTEIWVCERICGRSMQSLGYDRTGAKPTPWGLLFWSLWLVPHLALAMIVNLRRFGGVFSALRRRLNG